jgi:hypothetical protein
MSNPIIHLIDDLQGKNGASYDVSRELRKEVERWGSRPMVMRGPHDPAPGYPPTTKPPYKPSDFSQTHQPSLSQVPWASRKLQPGVDGLTGVREHREAAKTTIKKHLEIGWIICLAGAIYLIFL